MNKPEHLFSNLVLSLATAAMQQMGKIVDPLSGKTQTDLRQAQATIDVLDVLEQKTKGNLTPEEARLLGHVLGDLKLNYVETLNEKPSAGSAEAPQVDAAAPEAAAEPEQKADA